MFQKSLLIQPWIYDFAAYDLWMQPVGLLKLSTFLKSKNHEVFYINCLDRYDKDLSKITKSNEFGCGKFFKEKIPKPEVLSFVQRYYYRYGLPLDIVEKKLANTPTPDYIFISSVMTYWYPAVFDMIKLVRKFFKDTPIMLGGIYASLLPEHVLSSHGLSGGSKRINKEFWISRTSRGMTTKIKELNFSPQHIMNQKQDRTLLTNKKVHILQTSYGCPFKCSYCASKKIFPNFIQRDPLNVVDEMIESVEKTDTTDFVFYDDALLINNEKHIKIILQEWIKKDFDKIRFHTPNGLHARFIDKEIAELMFKSGFKTIRLSLETTSPILQNKSEKVSNEEFIKAVDNLKNAGYEARDIDVYIMMGMPGQTENQLMKDIFWAHNLGVRIVLASFSPVPGTEDFKELCKQGIIQENEDPLLHNNTIFIYRLGFNDDKIKEIRSKVAELNLKLKL